MIAKKGLVFLLVSNALFGTAHARKFSGPEAVAVCQSATQISQEGCLDEFEHHVEHVRYGVTLDVDGRTFSVTVLGGVKSSIPTTEGVISIVVDPVYRPVEQIPLIRGQIYTHESDSASRRYLPAMFTTTKGQPVTIEMPSGNRIVVTFTPVSE